jgi:hypothetical protein
VASFTLLVSGLLMDEQITDHSIISVLNNNHFYESQLLNSKIYSDLHNISERLELNEKLALARKEGYISEERIFNRAKEKYSIDSIEELDTLEEEVIKKLEKDLIDEDISEIERNILNTSDIKYLKYYLKSDLVELSNTEDSMARAFSTSEMHIIRNQSENIISPDEFMINSYGFRYTLDNIYDKTDIFYMSFPDKTLKSLKGDYLYTKRIAENRLKESVIYLSVGIVSLLLLMIIIGRKGDSDTVQMNFIDKLYTDINLVILSILVVTYIIIMSEFLQMGLNEIEYYVPLTIFATTIGLLLFLSIIKHLKNRTFIKHSLVFTFLLKVFYSIKNIFNMGSLGVKIILLLVLYTALVLFSVLIYPLTIIAIPVFLILLLWLINIRGINKVKTGIQKIKLILKEMENLKSLLKKSMTFVKV